MGVCQKDTTERVPNGQSKTFKAKNNIVLDHNTKYKIPESILIQVVYKWLIKQTGENKQISLAEKFQVIYVNKHHQGGGQRPTL